MFVQKKGIGLILVVFLSTLLIRYHQYYVFREFNSDKARQLHGAYNLLKNKGISIESYDLNTFKPLYRYVNDWPPAYSYLTAGITFLTGTNLYTSSVILDLLSTTLLWLVLLYITRMLQFTLLQQVLLFLFLSVSKTVLPQFLSADLLGVTVFLFSCALNINYIQQQVKSNMQNLVFYGLQLTLFIFLVFLKFSLIPAVVASGLSIILFAFSNKKMEYLKQGFVILALCFLSLGILYIFNKQVSGDSVTYQKVVTESVLHFDNLLLFNPFVSTAFFYLAPLYLRFDPTFLNTLSLFITLLSISVFLAFFFKNLLQKSLNLLEVLLFTTMVTVCSFLALVSLRFPKDDQNGYQWTFVAEYRYFAPVIILFLLFAYRFFKLKNHKGFYSLYFSILVGISCASTFLLEGYYMIINNRSTSFDNLYGSIFKIGDFMKKHDDEETYFMSLTKHQPTDTELTSLVALKGGKVVVTYSDYFPDSTTNAIFTQDKIITPGKKLVVYYGQNKTVLQSINQKNNYWIEKSENGDELLIIKN